jgi:curved DNA-binding protein CbpA
MGSALAVSTIDHYRTFGLEPSAGFGAVQGAYKILVRHLHPDVNPQAADAMRRANVAFEALRQIEAPTPAAEFTLDTTPVLRRARAGFDPIARYREAAADPGSRPGTLVDVFA